MPNAASLHPTSVIHPTTLVDTSSDSGRLQPHWSVFRLTPLPSDPCVLTQHVHSHSVWVLPKEESKTWLQQFTGATKHCLQAVASAVAAPVGKMFFAANHIMNEHNTQLSFVLRKYIAQPGLVLLKNLWAAKAEFSIMIVSICTCTSVWVFELSSGFWVRDFGLWGLGFGILKSGPWILDVADNLGILTSELLESKLCCWLSGF